MKNEKTVHGLFAQGASESSATAVRRITCTALDAAGSDALRLARSDARAPNLECEEGYEP